MLFALLCMMTAASGSEHACDPYIALFLSLLFITWRLDLAVYSGTQCHVAMTIIVVRTDINEIIFVLLQCTNCVHVQASIS